MRIIGTALCGLLLGSSAVAADKSETKVQVGGATYRVTVVDNVVTVAKKSLVVKFTMEERDAQREAVRKATGCEVVDEFPNGAKLKGRLRCSPSAPR